MTLSLFEDLAPASPPPLTLPALVIPAVERAGMRLYLGDCVDVLRALPANSVDAVITDGPYGIGYMGREWDTFNPDADYIVEAHTRVNTMRDSDNPNLRGRQRSPGISPSAVEYDRSLEGQRGFQAFTARWAAEAIRVLKPGGYVLSCGAPRSYHRMASGLEDAGFEVRDSLAWLFGQGFPKSHNLGDGRGTALKPAYEPIAVARKPLEGTVAANVARFGTGALNIDACRVPTAPGDRDPRDGFVGDLGRWPANVLGDEAALEELGEKARFFYCPKPSRAERDLGCESLAVRTPGQCTDRKEGSAGITPYAGAGRSGGGRNFHPTVKPIALMRWLIRLVTPPGGTVIDPFLGSGTTGIAAVLEGDGHPFIGIDREAEYVNLGDLRIAGAERIRKEATA